MLEVNKTVVRNATSFVV